MDIYICIYVYIYIHTHTYLYLHFFLREEGEREGEKKINVRGKPPSVATCMRPDQGLYLQPRYVP